MLTAAMSQNIKGREKGKGRRMMLHRGCCVFTTIRGYLVLQSTKMIPSGELLTKSFQKEKYGGRQWRLNPDCTPRRMTENKLHMWSNQNNRLVCVVVDYCSKLNLNISSQITGKNERLEKRLDVLLLDWLKK